MNGGWGLTVVESRGAQATRIKKQVEISCLVRRSAILKDLKAVENSGALPFRNVNSRRVLARNDWSPVLSSKFLYQNAMTWGRQLHRKRGAEARWIVRANAEKSKVHHHSKTSYDSIRFYQILWSLRNLFGLCRINQHMHKYQTRLYSTLNI